MEEGDKALPGSDPPPHTAEQAACGIAEAATLQAPACLGEFLRKGRRQMGSHVAGTVSPSILRMTAGGLCICPG